MNDNKLKITIVGGGPVGLFLGIALSKLDIDCTIIEKRSTPIPDSRSLGIHPISMQFFEKLGITDPFLKRGLRIKKGIAHDGNKQLGEINFELLEGPYNFILACPQFTTEQILTKQFNELNPKRFITNAEVTSVQQNDEKAICSYQKKGEEHCISSDFIIGCDGNNSFVRQEAGIFFGGKRYPDTYIMGDFEDTTKFGSNAAVFLPTQGMIECFPLPNGMRRWVVKTEEFVKEPTQQLLAELVHKRLSYDISNTESTMLSSFGVQNFMAEQFFKGRVLLCGDSAHVVSPIGGQGMNLGWIGAWKLAQALDTIRRDSKNTNHYLLNYQKEQKRIVKKAARRAEMNMRLGRKQRLPLFHKMIVQLLLKTPLKNLATRQFAMKNLFKI